MTEPANQPLRILHLEDNAQDQLLVREMLEAEGLRLVIDRASSRVEFESALRRANYDLIISDFTLPSYDGQAALAQARRLQPSAAFIFFSGTIGEEIAVECLKTGATDYVLKQRPKRLISAVRRAMDETTGRRRREAAEHALRQSEERFRIVARATHDVIWDWDVNTNYLWHNDSFSLAFGHRKSPERFSDLTDLIHDDDRHRVVSSLSALITAGGRVWWSEYRLRRENGTYAYVYDRAHVIYEKNRKPQRIIGVMIDMTERKEAEEKLREQAALLQKAHDAVIVCDLEDKVVFWNPSAERIYDWTAAEATGRPVVDLIFLDSQTQFDEAKKYLLQRGEWIGELRQNNRDQRPVFVQSSWTLVRDEEGRPKSQLIIATDITAKRQLEEQLLRAQRLESLGVLVGGIAHDLNNALAPVLMGAAVLEMMPLPDGGAEILKTIESSARRGADMVKQVLTFARGDTGAMSPVRINQLMKEMCQIINDTFPPAIRCTCDLPSDLWSVNGVATQVHQVLMNLCVNARDAMETGGKISLATSNVEVDARKAAVHPGALPGNYVCLTVADTGGGIPPDKLAHIFKPFYSTKLPGKGTGLGLSTVEAIVRNHSGFITVSSEVGKGTKFNVYLPTSKTTSETRPAAPLLLPEGNNEGILVIDDEGAVLAVMKASLENYDYRVFTASSGLEAVALFSEKHADIQLVITDLSMPFMDGVATIQALRKVRPNIRVIAASGLDWTGDNGQDAPELVQAFLRKPFTVEKLLLAVRDVLTKPSA